MSIGVFEYVDIQPFAALGLTGPFWTVHADIILTTWFAMLLIFLLSFLVRCTWQHSTIIGGFGEHLVGTFLSLCEESIATFKYCHVVFIGTLFLFTFFCCAVSIFPFVEESTRDLNTTLAIALSSFIYVQFFKIKTHGISGFLKEFIEPTFVIAPIHVAGELAKVASMAFRLFGNICGGGVILAMGINALEAIKEPFLIYVGITLACMLLMHYSPLGQKIPLCKKITHILCACMFLVSWFQMFFCIFEGLIQSFLIALLTSIYLGMGTEQHDAPSTSPHAKEVS